MKRLKRLCSILVCAVVIFTVVPLSGVTASASTYGDFEYYISNGAAKINAYYGNSKDVIIPDDINGYTVNEIGDYVFRYDSDIVSVSIPDSVVKIGNSAFADCNNLVEVGLSGKLKSLGDDAFLNCSSLISIVLPSTVTYLGDRAFSGCSSLREIAIPGKIQTIGYETFAYCTGLTKVKIDEGVSKIDVSAFRNCETLSKINFPETITTIDIMSFYECYALHDIKIPKSVIELSNSAFSRSGYSLDKKNWEGPAMYIGDCLVSVKDPLSYNSDQNYVYEEFTVKPGTRLIANGAFNFCIYLSTVIIPDTIKIIGSTAFYSCNGLYDVYYKGTLTQRDKIVFGHDNANIVNAIWTYNYLSKPIVEVKNSSNGAKVTWNKVPGATSYRVCRSVYSGGKWSEYKLFAKPTTNSYTDKTVKSGTKYKYVIYAYNGNYKSEYSSSATTVYLKQPTVKLTNAKTGVYVSWGKVSGATSYKVYRSVYSGGKWSEYKLFAKPTANYYTDKTVKSGARVRYTVYACNGSYQSLYKTGVITTYLSPRTPKVGKASNGIKVSWTKATGAKGYTVYRRTYSGGKWSDLTAMVKTAKLTYTDKNAKKGVKYQYVVRAYNGNYKSIVVYSTTIKR